MPKLVRQNEKCRYTKARPKINPWKSQSDIQISDSMDSSRDPNSFSVGLRRGLPRFRPTVAADAAPEIPTSLTDAERIGNHLSGLCGSGSWTNNKICGCVHDRWRDLVVRQPDAWGKCFRRRD